VVQCCSFLCGINFEELGKRWAHGDCFHTSAQQWSLWALWQLDTSFRRATCLFRRSKSSTWGKHQHCMALLSLSFVMMDRCSPSCLHLNLVLPPCLHWFFPFTRIFDWIGMWWGFSALCSIWIPMSRSPQSIRSLSACHQCWLWSSESFPTGIF